jgi:hypothetical protein
VARIARNSVSTVKQAWEACRGMLGEWVGRARRALFPVVEEKPPVSGTQESLTEECWMQIEFDILEKLHPRAAQKQAQIAVKEESTQDAAPAMPAPSRKYWRKYRPSATVVVSARNSISSVKRKWSVVGEPIVEYVRSVEKSFVRDCRMLFQASLVPTPAAGVRASVDGNNRKPRSTVHKNAIALVHWLQEPMRPPRASSRRSTLRGK